MTKCITFRHERMRCSWVKKNRSRNKIDWERTKNDVKSVVSLFGGNLIHTTTSRGRSGFGGEDLRGRLATGVVAVVASGTWWSILDLVLVLGALTGVMACLTTLVADSIYSAGSRVVRWRLWTRRHIRWRRWVVLTEHAIGDPDLALLRARTG